MTAWLILITVFGHALPVTSKTVYAIGGWLPGTPDSMLKALTPLFEDYLNANVGTLYSPQISFKLKPVDFSAETDSDALISSGALDFLCEMEAELNHASTI